MAEKSSGWPSVVAVVVRPKPIAITSVLPSSVSAAPKVKVSEALRIEEGWTGSIHSSTQGSRHRARATSARHLHVTQFLE